MTSIARFLRKIQLLFGRERFRDELNEEMAFHRAAVEKNFVEEGMTAEAARYAARGENTAASAPPRMIPTVTQRMKSSICTSVIGAGPPQSFSFLISARA